MGSFHEEFADGPHNAREFNDGLLRQGFTDIPGIEEESGGPTTMADWFSEASAFARPEGVLLLDSLVTLHSMTFDEFEAENLGATGAVALGQLMRAGYVLEGASRLHATDLGRIAYADYLAKHPRLAALSSAGG